MLRVPVGFLYIGIAVLVVLLMGSYWFGYLRGDSVARAAWDRDRADSLAVDRQMRAVLEVDEPGGAMRDQPPTQQVGTIPAVLEEPAQARPSVPAAMVKVAPAPVAIEPLSPASPVSTVLASWPTRVEGMNYYIIDHPSRQKVAELVAFCRKHGLGAHQTVSSSGIPKVFVIPGYIKGQSALPEIMALRERIRRVGILWEREDPGRNSDFSTRYAEKYRPSG